MTRGHPSGHGRAARRLGSPAERYRIAPGIAHREVAGQTLLLGPGPGMLFTLNDTGQLVWRRLQRRRTVTEIAEALRRTFGVPPERAERDVRAFLGALEARGFVIRA